MLLHSSKQRKHQFPRPNCVHSTSYAISKRTPSCNLICDFTDGALEKQLKQCSLNIENSKGFKRSIVMKNHSDVRVLLYLVRIIQM